MPVLNAISFFFFFCILLRGILKVFIVFKYNYCIIYENLAYISDIGLMSRVCANGPGDWRSIPGQGISKTQK